MAFRFRLESVLRHRRRVVDLRGRDVAAAAGVVAELTRAIVDARARQREAADEGARAVDVVRRRRCADWIAHLEGEIEHLHRRRLEARAGLDAARERLRSAWREREVLEKLRERRYAGWRRDRERRERAELDEIGREIVRGRGRPGFAGEEAEVAARDGTETAARSPGALK